MSTCFDAISRNRALAIGLTVLTLGIGYLGYHLVKWISNTEAFEKVRNCFKKLCCCTTKQQDPTINLVGDTVEGTAEDTEETPKKPFLRQPATHQRNVTVKKLDRTLKQNLTSPVEIRVQTEQVRTLPKPDSTVLTQKEPGKIFESKFPKGFAPSPDFDKECGKLQNFLSTEIARLEHGSDADLIYVCMGHGNVGEQIWPGFVLEQLQSGKTVHSVLFDYGDPYPLYMAKKALGMAYRSYPDANSRLYDYLDNCFSVDQFLCGIPRIHERTHEDITDRDESSSSYYATSYWKTKKQVQEVHENFQLYIRTLLSQGKQIVLGDHSGAIEPPNYLVNVYNTLLKEYPKQLHFLWTWENHVNAMTNQSIQSEDTVPEQTKAQGTIWTDYPKKSGGLYRCKLP